MTSALDPGEAITEKAAKALVDKRSEFPVPDYKIWLHPRDRDRLRDEKGHVTRGSDLDVAGRDVRTSQQIPQGCPVAMPDRVEDFHADDRLTRVLVDDHADQIIEGAAIEDVSVLDLPDHARASLQVPYEIVGKTVDLDDALMNDLGLEIEGPVPNGSVLQAGTSIVPVEVTARIASVDSDDVDDRDRLRESLRVSLRDHIGGSYSRPVYGVRYVETDDGDEVEKERHRCGTVTYELDRIQLPDLPSFSERDSDLRGI